MLCPRWRPLRAAAAAAAQPAPRGLPAGSDWGFQAPAAAAVAAPLAPLPSCGEPSHGCPLRLPTRPAGPPIRRRLAGGSRRYASGAPPGEVKLVSGEQVSLADFTPDLVRNFCITAHVDHGKTTLSSALLRHTGTRADADDLFMDKLQVEQERGITVKAQSASMFVRCAQSGKLYLLNLIDTPGHVDFAYEVRRSMTACKGAVLLVDVSQGIEAQTLANAYLAMDNDLTMIYALSKMDRPDAADRSSQTLAQMEGTLGCTPEEVVRLSARTGLGLDDLLQRVISDVPKPDGDPTAPLRCYLFDAAYSGKTLVVFVLVVDGVLTEKVDLRSFATSTDMSVKEVGILHPDEVRTGALYPGQFGWLVLKEPLAKSDLVMGDTLFARPRGTMFTAAKQDDIKPFRVVPAMRPTIFANFFPGDGTESGVLEKALDKLCANDPSVSSQRISSPALGPGWRLGFLGLLHLQVFEQRLEQEYEVPVFVTPPSVTYRAHLRNAPPEELVEIEPTDWPDRTKADQYYEPWAAVQIVTPQDHVPELMAYVQSCRGVYKSQDPLDESRTVLSFRMPLQETIQTLFNNVKAITSGYGTVEYEEDGQEVADLAKMEVLINREKNEALTFIMPRERGMTHARAVAKRLKEGIETQAVDIAVQVLLDGKSVAKEVIKAFKKDVTSKCYGGDITRKMKKINQQKAGMKEKKAKFVGGVRVDQQTFMDIVMMTD
eukprot:TRINITY_DN6868_c1_g1_i1.p1 TRINITY_DN6868_c1_g1~~TRINITY_DN6868_c1_g1_i1.p1  ORF type:complete len:747 (+),score=232.36 TRINITY_DN6868_c1_g1_i1:95-2242(+)